MNRTFPSLSGKTSIRTVRELEKWEKQKGGSFHPFQGRPLFGPRRVERLCGYIRRKVSIPFREDLYSDSHPRLTFPLSSAGSFHPFQGRPLFGHGHRDPNAGFYVVEFPSLSGKTSIRTRKFVDINTANESFHPFQGRPLFGRKPVSNCAGLLQVSFPSLSGKTSIRTAN